MKLNFVIPGLLIALLVGCNDTTTVATSPSPSAAANPTSNPVVSEQTPTPTPTPVVSEKIPTPTSTSTKPTNPFDSDSFPKAGCGDEMPTDKKTDTVKLYPVFVDYSDSNLKTIKTNYCGDALKITTKDQGKKYVIQVASFTDEKRVNQFKEFLARKLGSTSVEVGEATVIGAKPIPKSTKNVTKAAQPTGDQQNQDKKADSVVGADNSPYAIGKAAKLTTQEVEKLMSLEKSDLVLKDKLKMEQSKVKAIVPTYIPPGFKVKKINTSKHSYSHYGIEYGDSSDSNFRIATGCCFCGDEPLGYKEVQVSSRKLGKIIVAYTYFDNDINKSDLVCATGILYNKNTGREYFFSGNVNIREAVKIVESLQYLNP